MKKLLTVLTVGSFISVSFSQIGGLEKMKAMAMENMKRFMAMSPAERKEYVAKKEKEALSLGEELYNSYGCAGCHPKGRTIGGKAMDMPIPSLKGVKERFPKFKPGNDYVITLSDMINNCIVMFVNKEPLPLDSKEMRALTYFVSKIK